MKKFGKILFSPAATIVAFALAAGLLLFGSIGGTRAALTYFSEYYASQVQMYDIGVSLMENGRRVSWRDYDYENADGTWDEHIVTKKSDGSWDEHVLGELLYYMLERDKDGNVTEKLQLDHAYQEQLNVLNSGTINQYVRVTIYRYWLVEGVDAYGKTIWEKDPSLDPSPIELHYVNLGTAWLEDESAATNERRVFYYNRLLDAGDETPLLSDYLVINGEKAQRVEKTILEDGTEQSVYVYKGARFCLDARVDAVQENNAEDAVLSAWGKQVVVNEDAGTLRLK